MDSISREAMLNEINESLEKIFEHYNLDDIAFYEEENIDHGYSIGYTIKKDDEIHKIRLPFIKNEHGEFTRVGNEIVIEGHDGISKGYENLEDVLSYLELGF